MKENNSQDKYESKLEKLFEKKQLDKRGVLVSKTEAESSSKVNETKSEIKPTEKTIESKKTNRVNLEEFLKKDNDITLAEATGFNENITEITRIKIDLNKNKPIVDNGK